MDYAVFFSQKSFTEMQGRLWFNTNHSLLRYTSIANFKVKGFPLKVVEAKLTKPTFDASAFNQQLAGSGEHTELVELNFDSDEYSHTDIHDSVNSIRYILYQTLAMPGREKPIKIYAFNCQHDYRDLVQTIYPTYEMDLPGRHSCSCTSLF